MLKKQVLLLKRKVAEFKGFDEEYNLGDTITVEHFTKENLLILLRLQKVKDFKVL